MAPALRANLAYGAIAFPGDHEVPCANFGDLANLGVFLIPGVIEARSSRACKGQIDRKCRNRNHKRSNEGDPDYNRPEKAIRGTKRNSQHVLGAI